MEDRKGIILYPPIFSSLMIIETKGKGYGDIT